MDETSDNPAFQDDFFIPADEDHIRREKARARELRDSQWWRNLRGRGVCHYCGRRVPPGELTMDHIVPIVRGGRSTKGNIVACCRKCNSEKKYLTPVEWKEFRRDDAPPDQTR